MAPIAYKIIRSRRKTAAIQIVDGTVVVRCPYGTREEWIHQFVHKKESWIRSHLTATPTDKFTVAELSRLKALAQAQLPPRVAQLAAVMGVSYGRIAIRAQHSRWGSCSGKGNLNFNCLLMLVPEEVRDYIIIHELCHRRHMNHSKDFWAAVERCMPAYKSHRAWLKTHGTALIRRLP